MNSVKVGAIGFALLAALPVSGCAGGGSAPAPQPAPPPQNSVQVQSPKDAHAVQLCDLLPPAAAQSLGLPPKGELQQDALDTSKPPVCAWHADNADPLSVIFRVDDLPIGQLMNEKPPMWGDYAKLTVAGYPAVRGNMADPAKYGFCDIYLGTQDNQMLVSQVALPRSQAGKADGCQVAQKSLEAAVASLPPAK